jgi:site-specific DNA-methyltransferase (adenine-specific)
MQNINLIHGDCLEKMKDIPDNSIDLVLTDPPYGTTKCKWDTVISFELMWKEIKRVTKDNGAICLFGSEPFSSALRMSNVKMYKYDWVWQKDKASNFMQANKRPANVTEVCSVFYKKPPAYKSQKTINPKGVSRRHLAKPTTPTEGGRKTSANVKAAGGRGTSSPSYEPDKLLGKNLIYFAREQRGKLHPTQKPISLLEHLVRAYTLESETVLDFTMGSGSTGVACKNLKRKFIGIEKDLKYFEISKERIEKLSSYDELYPNG